MADRGRTGFAAMNNPKHILQTLDRHLTKPAELTIFGRAALVLGFQDSPAAFATTHDVDAILSNFSVASGSGLTYPERCSSPQEQTEETETGQDNSSFRMPGAEITKW